MLNGAPLALTFSYNVKDTKLSLPPVFVKLVLWIQTEEFTWFFFEFHLQLSVLVCYFQTFSEQVVLNTILFQCGLLSPVHGLP